MIAHPPFDDDSVDCRHARWRDGTRRYR
jgi:hypothetical protein